jgi:hypothetical protein
MSYTQMLVDLEKWLWQHPGLLAGSFLNEDDVREALRESAEAEERVEGMADELEDLRERMGRISAEVW